MEWPKQILYCLGCGPGAAEYVTPRVQIIAQHSQILVGCPRSLALFSSSAATQWVYQNNLEDLLQRVQEALAAGLRIAWLCTGDTSLFSVARLVRQKVGHEHCRLEPGVSSVQLACARLGLDWARLRIISAHGRFPLWPEPAELVGIQSVAILAGSPQCLQSICDWAEQHTQYSQLWVCADLSLAEEHIQSIPLHELERWITHPRVLFLFCRNTHEPS